MKYFVLVSYENLFIKITKQLPYTQLAAAIITQATLNKNKGDQKTTQKVKTQNLKKIIKYSLSHLNFLNHLVKKNCEKSHEKLLFNLRKSRL